MSGAAEAALLIRKRVKRARIIGDAADESYLRGLRDAHRLAQENQQEMEKEFAASKPEHVDYWRGTVNAARVTAERIRMKIIMAESREKKR